MDIDANGKATPGELTIGEWLMQNGLEIRSNLVCVVAGAAPQHPLPQQQQQQQQQQQLHCQHQHQHLQPLLDGSQQQLPQNPAQQLLQVPSSFLAQQHSMQPACSDHQPTPDVSALRDKSPDQQMSSNAALSSTQTAQVQTTQAQAPTSV